MKLPPLPPFAQRLLIGVVVLALAYYVAGGHKGISGFFKLQRDVHRLQTQVRQAETTIDSLQDELSRLRTDTAYIEQVAREKLGMARRDEMIYKFVEKK